MLRVCGAAATGAFFCAAAKLSCPTCAQRRFLRRSATAAAVLHSCPEQRSQKQQASVVPPPTSVKMRSARSSSRRAATSSAAPARATAHRAHALCGSRLHRLRGPPRLPLPPPASLLRSIGLPDEAESRVRGNRGESSGAWCATTRRSRALEVMDSPFMSRASFPAAGEVFTMRSGGERRLFWWFVAEQRLDRGFRMLDLIGNGIETLHMARAVGCGLCAAGGCTGGGVRLVCGGQLRTSAGIAAPASSACFQKRAPATPRASKHALREHPTTQVAPPPCACSASADRRLRQHAAAAA